MLDTLAIARTLTMIGALVQLLPERLAAAQPTDRNDCQPLLDDADRVRSLKPSDDDWPLFIRCIVYSTGEGVPQDYVEAAKWFHRAAVRNHASAQGAPRARVHARPGVVERQRTRARMAESGGGEAIRVATRERRERAEPR